jgi:hypothetical protein
LCLVIAVDAGVFVGDGDDVGGDAERTIELLGDGVDDIDWMTDSDSSDTALDTHHAFLVARSLTTLG